MNVRYIANIRLPSEHTHGIQIMSMCRAFANAGWTMELLVSGRRNPTPGEPFAYYGMPASFSIRKLKSPDVITLGGRLRLPLFISYTLDRVLFAITALRDARAHPADLYYVRDEFSFQLFSWCKLPVVWEMHVVPKRLNWYRNALRRGIGVVPITEAIAAEVRASGMPAGRILVAPDGADIAAYATLHDTAALRRTHGIGADTVVWAYTGQLYGWKGVDTLVEAANGIPSNVTGLIIGGSGEPLESLRARITKNNLSVRALGQIPHFEVPQYLALADMVIIPNSANNRMARYTSPLKLFEAMAAGKAIVASDIPSLREILDETIAVLVPPDNAEALRDAIAALAQDPEHRTRLGESARARAGQYDWNERAKRIAAFVAHLRGTGAHGMMSETQS